MLFNVLEARSLRLKIKLRSEIIIKKNKDSCYLSNIKCFGRWKKSIYVKYKRRFTQV